MWNILRCGVLFRQILQPPTKQHVYSEAVQPGKTPHNKHEQIVKTSIQLEPGDRERFINEMPVVYWLSSQEMDTAIRVQILDETDCISHSTNTLGKGMNPIILPSALVRQLV